MVRVRESKRVREKATSKQKCAKCKLWRAAAVNRLFACKKTAVLIVARTMVCDGVPTASTVITPCTLKALERWFFMACFSKKAAAQLNTCAIRPHCACIDCAYCRYRGVPI